MDTIVQFADTCGPTFYQCPLVLVLYSSSTPSVGNIRQEKQGTDAHADLAGHFTTAHDGD